MVPITYYSGIPGSENILPFTCDDLVQKFRGILAGLNMFASLFATIIE